MYEAKRSDLQLSRVNGDTCLCVPILVQNVVVAFDEPDSQVGKVLSPPAEERQLLVLAAMKKIPYDEQLPRLKILDLCQQPVKVLLVNRSRHGDA